MAGRYWIWETRYKREAEERPGFICHKRTAWVRPISHQEQIQKLEKFLEQMIEGIGKQQANRMGGLTSQRAGEPTHGNLIFIFFTLEEFAGSQSKGKAMTNLDSVLKQRHPFADKGPYSQSYGFSSSHTQL